MQVTIREIRAGSSVPVPGTSRLGYLARFETPLVSGWATLVPCAGSSGALVPGRRIHCDVRQEHVSRFDPAPPEGELRIEPLDSPGDYEVRGRVVCVWDSGDFGVEAGGFLFALGRDDAHGQPPPEGAVVAFTVHGLSLWHRGV